MDSHDFCLWLAGWLDARRALTAEEVATIRRRLSDVFVHEIDPTLGDEAHVAELRRLHEGDDHRGPRLP